jgi:Mce-associated membrane protein
VIETSGNQTTEDESTVPSATDAEKVEVVAAEESTEESNDAENADETTEPITPRRRIQWPRVFAYGVLPALALLLALGAGYLKWMDNSVRDSETARDAAVQSARESTIALLSYKPETVEQQLGAARDLSTGDFRDAYTSLTNDVVIPGAKQKHISAVATVPAVASVSADPRHAVVMVFVNQTVIIGQDAPTETASIVRVTLDKIGDRWLVSKFDPV